MFIVNQVSEKKYLVLKSCEGCLDRTNLSSQGVDDCLTLGCSEVAAVMGPVCCDERVEVDLAFGDGNLDRVLDNSEQWRIEGVHGFGKVSGGRADLADGTEELAISVLVSARNKTGGSQAGGKERQEHRWITHFAVCDLDRGKGVDLRPKSRRADRTSFEINRCQGVLYIFASLHVVLQHYGQDPRPCQASRRWAPGLAWNEHSSKMYRHARLWGIGD